VDAPVASEVNGGLVSSKEQLGLVVPIGSHWLIRLLLIFAMTNPPVAQLRGYPRAEEFPLFNRGSSGPLSRNLVISTECLYTS